MTSISGHEWLQPYQKFGNTLITYTKYSGHWVLDQKCPAFLQCGYYLYTKSLLTIMHIFAITIFTDIYLNRDNMSVTTDDGCIFAGMCVVIFKAMNFQFRRERIGRLIEETLKCANDLCEFSTEDAKKVIDKYLFRNKVSFYGFCFLGLLLTVALLLFSPPQNGLPIRAKYPFDTNISPWREIGFSIETFAVSGGVAAIIASDSIMSFLYSMITLQFDILNMNFEKCTGRLHTVRNNLDMISSEKHYNQNNSNPKNIANDFTSQYRRYLQFHQRLIFLVNDHNKIFSWSMFVQMFSSTSIICLTSFQAVAVGGQSKNIIKFGIYLSAAISQLFYVCWLGNQLTTSSSLVEKSQWLSEWQHEHLHDVAQLLMLSLIFSRQSLQLKAGVFYVLSLETFIGIMRGSYSFFTLLNNMHSVGGR